MVAAMRDAAMSSGGVSPGYAELLRQYAYHAGPGRVERHYREHQHAKNLLHRHRAPPNRSNQNAAFRIGGSAPAHRKAPGLRPELIAQRTNPSYPLGKGAGPPIPERKPERASPRCCAMCSVRARPMAILLACTTARGTRRIRTRPSRQPTHGTLRVRVSACRLATRVG